jgi:hypothetical protein
MAIATRYKSTPALLASANRLEKGADLAAGDRLVIPGGYHEAAPKPVRVAAANPKAKSGRRAVASSKPLVKTVAKTPATKVATLARPAHPAAAAALVR